MKKEPFVHHLLIIASYILFAIVMTYPAVRYINITNLGDQALNTWVLASNYHSLITNPLKIFETNIYFPLRSTLTFLDPNIAPVVIFFFVFNLTNDFIISHNIIGLSNYVLSAYFMYLLSYELTKCRKSAYLAGFIYAFCYFSISHIHWVQLGAQWLPFTLLFLIRYREKHSKSDLAFFYLGILLQIYSGLYYFIYLVLTVGLFFFCFSGDVLQLTKYRRKYFTGLIFGGFITIILASPIIYTYSVTHEEYKLVRTGMDLLIGKASWHDYLMPYKDSFFFNIHQRFFPLPMLYWEKYLFPGALAVLSLTAVLPLAFVSILKRERINSWNYLIYFFITGLFFLFLSFGPNKGREWSLFSITSSFVPGLLNIRVPARAGIIVIFSTAIVSSFGFALIFRYLNERRKMVFVVFAACLLFLAVEYWAPDKGLSTHPYRLDKIPEVYSWVAQNVQNDEGIIELPLGDIHKETLRMLYSTSHWKNIVNGYAGYPSPFVGELNYYGLDQFSKKSFGLLKKSKVRYAVIEKKIFKYDLQKLRSEGLSVIWENEDHLVLELY